MQKNALSCYLTGNITMGREKERTGGRERNARKYNIKRRANRLKQNRLCYF